MSSAPSLPDARMYFTRTHPLYHQPSQPVPDTVVIHDPLAANRMTFLSTLTAELAAVRRASPSSDRALAALWEAGTSTPSALVLPTPQAPRLRQRRT